MNRRVLGTIFFLAFANFALSFVFAVIIGGDARAGKIENGHYFVGSHGKLIEVSAAIFEFSLWQTRSVIVTHPLGLLAAFLAYRQQAQARRGS